MRDVNRDLMIRVQGYEDEKRKLMIEKKELEKIALEFQDQVTTKQNNEELVDDGSFDSIRSSISRRRQNGMEKLKDENAELKQRLQYIEQQTSVSAFSSSLSLSSSLYLMKNNNHACTDAEAIERDDTIQSLKKELNYQSQLHEREMEEMPTISI